MAPLTLVIGNQNYSSWSMRPWVLMRQLGIAFDEVKLRFHSAEWYPGHGVWPADPGARAYARSAAAEMHSGFRELRTSMPMNIRTQHSGKGMTAGTRGDIERIEGIWAHARERFGSGGPFLCGAFSAVDAMYAPVVMRFATYAVPISDTSARYCEAMRAAPGVHAWVQAALQEKEFVAEDEPYATAPA
jgi:glutathione S-transferase